MKNVVLFTAAILLMASAAIALAQSRTRPNTIHPIVDVRYGYLLGGSRNGKWLGDKATAAGLRGAESYQVWGTASRLGATTGSKPRTDEAPCDQTWWITPRRNFGSGIIALGANWNAQPRKVRAQNVSNTFYRNEVARILRQAGLRNPRVVLSQLWRVDLEGDGQEEVLFSATNYASAQAGPMQISPNAKAGEYSLVLLRKVVNGRVQTLTLVREIYAEDKTFSAPSEHRLATVLDANGDGKMEIAVRSGYYEGDSLALFEVSSQGVKEVLSSGCGA